MQEASGRYLYERRRLRPIIEAEVDSKGFQPRWLFCRFGKRAERTQGFESDGHFKSDSEIRERHISIQEVFDACLYAVAVLAVND